MDSTLVASSIRKMGRLQLLVEVLQCVHRMLDEQDLQQYAEGLLGFPKLAQNLK